ncbi:jg2918 [Pararge aegeria aegeria]|uniref:Jg2918 protein n=2 Tax=Pararge aegeria TaxID=116150 RepID=A0A8S4SDH3_9NEOP|nr:jg2918 [Pararge aegeria aegeria]
MQIKYCFDINVEPFDGLPQLVCKKCESILSQYAGIKQIFQEKQKNLKSKLISNAKVENIIQQQQDTVSSTQADTDNKNKQEEITRLRGITPVPARHVSTESETSIRSQRKNKKSTQSKNSKKTWQSTYKKCFVCRFCAKPFKDIRDINRHIHKKCKTYKKYTNINKAYCLVRINKMGEKLNCTGSLDNVVISKNKIIQSSAPNFYVLYTNESKISYQNDSSESSDEDFFVDRKKYKRRRLISRSSNETVVIEQNTRKSSDDEKVDNIRKPTKNENTQIASDIECVNIDDSDSNSTKSSEQTKDLDSEVLTGRISTTNDKMVNNIIAMCFTKYMNRLNASDGSTSKGKEESSLKHKILSIGRKIICSNGINTTGLLRYMEHKNLEVVWISKIDTKVIIKTRSKESGDSDNSNFGWENITSLPNHNYVTKDFAVDFERISMLENSIKKKIEDKQLNQVNPQLNKTDKAGNTYLGNLKENQSVRKSQNCKPKLYDTTDDTSTQVSKIDKKVNDNYHLRAVLDADKNWTKLLNANPVANPKQLPKKNTFNEPASLVKIYSNELQNDSDGAENANTDQGNDTFHNMPIITSTVSLAPVDKDQSNVNCRDANANANNNKSVSQSTMPKIKVKPVSELMPEGTLGQQNNTFVSTTGWTVNNENHNQNVVLQTNTTNMVYVASGSFTNVIPLQQDVFYSQKQNIEGVVLNPNVNPSGSNQLGQKQDFVKLHTVDLPNTKTDSPFRYFKNLLQVHNIHLIDGDNTMTLSLNCLMKFKVLFEQDTNSPVHLCLFLLCETNVFCIKVMDEHLKNIDVSQFTANWQWELLKVFIGEDVVPKMLANALKINNSLYNQTAYFINLLRSIVFSKVP